MKKLLLILSLFLVTSCTNSWDESPLLVTSVRTVGIDNGFKYCIRINNHFNIYTNTEYSVGDTLK